MTSIVSYLISDTGFTLNLHNEIGEIFTDSVVDYYTSQFIDGAGEQLLQLIRDGKAQQIFDYVHQTLVKEFAKFDKIAHIYADQAKLTSDDKLKKALEAASKKASDIAAKISILDNSPGEALRVFEKESAPENAWTKLKNEVNAFNEYTLNAFLDDAPVYVDLALNFVPEVKFLGKVAVGIAMQDIKAILNAYGPTFKILLENQFQIRSGIKILENQGAYTVTRIGDTLIIGAEEGTAADFIIDEKTASPAWPAVNVLAVGNNEKNNIDLQGLLSTDTITVIAGGGEDKVNVVTTGVGTTLGTARVWGDDGKDELHVIADIIEVHGGEEDDQIYVKSPLAAFTGDMKLFGDAGNDTFHPEYGLNGIIDGGSGTDVVDYSDDTSAFGIHSYPNSPVAIDFNAKDSEGKATGAIEVDFAKFGSSGAGKQDLFDIEKIVFKSTDDTLKIESDGNLTAKNIIVDLAGGENTVDFTDVTQGVKSLDQNHFVNVQHYILSKLDDQLLVGKEGAPGVIDIDAGAGNDYVIVQELR